MLGALTGGRQHYHVVDADIQGFFDAIDQDLLLEKLATRISDQRVLKLLRQWLRAGVLEEGAVRTSTAGTPQGGVISPLLANIYLQDFDRIWTATCSHLGKLVRYADDFVILCRTRAQAEQALAKVREILTLLRLQLHPIKTRLLELGLGKEGFTFLGCYLRIVRSRFKGKCYLFRWPSPQAMTAIRTKIRHLTQRRYWAGMRNIREVIRKLNPVLRGWGGYFRTGNASDQFHAIDSYVHERLLRLLARNAELLAVEQAEIDQLQLQGRESAVTGGVRDDLTRERKHLARNFDHEERVDVFFGHDLLIHIDGGAAKAIVYERRSLLAIGISDVSQFGGKQSRKFS